MNILIIDDDKLMLASMQHIVESLGHNAFLALDSTDAIRHIRNYHVNFIFSDILMPGISGLSLIKVLRENYHIKVPIILMSSLKSSYVKKSKEYAGVNDFIEKPFTIADIAYKIDLYSQQDSSKLN